GGNVADVADEHYGFRTIVRKHIALTRREASHVVYYPGGCVVPNRVVFQKFAISFFGKFFSERQAIDTRKGIQSHTAVGKNDSGHQMNIALPRRRRKDTVVLSQSRKQKIAAKAVHDCHRHRHAFSEEKQDQSKMESQKQPNERLSDLLPAFLRDKQIKLLRFFF